MFIPFYAIRNAAEKSIIASVSTQKNDKSITNRNPQKPKPVGDFNSIKIDTMFEGWISRR